MTSLRRSPVVAALCGLLLCVVGACSGVPNSSAPQKVTYVAVSPKPSVPQPTPYAGESMEGVVNGFLQANVSLHAAAKTFLVSAEAAKWTDKKPVLILDTVAPGQADTVHSQVSLTANKIGTLDPSTGIYTPDLTNGDRVSIVFKLARIRGEWRISQVPSNLLISLEDFKSTYTAEPLYFFDLPEQRLVPDLRYSSISDPQAVDTWKLTQLLLGERDDLHDAVVSELPEQGVSGKAAVTVKSDSPVTVELPGSSRLGSALVKLAAQLALTFGQSDPRNPTVTLTDGGKPVSIPGKPTVFSPSDFDAETGLSQPQPPLYYLGVNSGLVDANGKPAGPRQLAAGHYGLTSVAVAQPDGTGPMLVAGSDNRSAFYVGSLTGGVKQVPLPARHRELTSRPAWAPGLPEVWVGARGAVLREVYGAAKPSVLTLASASGPVQGQILALRFSPEGSRIAVVIRQSAGGPAQLWLGPVSRNGNSVTIGNLQALTQVNMSLTDVAWANNDVTLMVSGTILNGNVSRFGVWTVQVDGSLLKEVSSNGLTSAPDALASAIGQAPWVSSGGDVFRQTSSTQWSAPDDNPVRGSSPNYVVQ